MPVQSRHRGGLVAVRPSGEPHAPSISGPGWRRLRRPDDVPWLVFDEEGKVVQPVRRFLIDFIARDNRTGSVRSYAYDLLRWWRWLRVVDVEWNRATSVEVRDFVLWLRAATKPRRSAHTHSAVTAGTTNPITKKTYLDDRYKPRTIRHSNAVLRSFYDFWIETGGGPLVTPVPLARSDRRPATRPPQPAGVLPGRGEAALQPEGPQAAPATDARRAVERAVRGPALEPGPGDPGLGRQQRRPRPRSCWACAGSISTGATSS
ncbi:site-specific integrase [Streptomyces sp. NPDC050448]|uniref:site-specific integrase n=1 Tax=Streptomyces sp. NPDC050448 TaxID=3155404 RepID=UPI00342A3455